MDWLDPLRDLLQPQQAKHLSTSLPVVHLVIERTESHRGNFIYPGTDTFSSIKVDGQRIGHVDYGINKLSDRLYIHKIEIDREYQR